MIHFNEGEQVIFKEYPDNPLIKTEEDRQFYLELLDLVNNNHSHYSAMINAKDRKNLKDWIFSKVPKLTAIKDFKHSMSTYVVWILEGREDFPICPNPNCGKQFGFHQNIGIGPVHGNVGYRLYCSDKCRDSSPFVKEHRRQTNQLHMGVDNPFQCESIKKKCTQKHIKNYGVEHASQSPIVKSKIRATVDKNKAKDPNYIKKIVAKTEATKERNHGDPHYNNIEQIKKTNLAIRGVEFPTQDPNVIQLRQQHNLAKYNVKETVQLPKIHDLALSAIFDKYGVKSVMQVPEIREKILSSMTENYGVSCTFLIPGIYNQFKERSLAKYGFEFPSQHPNVKAKIIQTRIEHFGTGAIPSKRYFYNNESFDSSSELEFWIYCIDHNIKIERSTKMYQYFVDGCKKYYNVDFEVEGQEIEIKGDQFFRSDGTMFCPYRNKKWSDQKYNYMNRCYEAKHKCMIANGVKILRSSELKYCKKYVEDHYGKDYLQQFKKKLNRNNND